MKQLFTLAAILLTVFSTLSQSKEQDSLVLQLAFQQQDSAKVKTSIALIKLLYTAQLLEKAKTFLLKLSGNGTLMVEDGVILVIISILTYMEKYTKVEI